MKEELQPLEREQQLLPARKNQSFGIMKDKNRLLEKIWFIFMIK